MKELAKSYMLKCPNAKIRYRFNSVSNFITFEQYVDERLILLEKENKLEYYCKVNKLIED